MKMSIPYIQKQASYYDYASAMKLSLIIYLHAGIIEIIDRSSKNVIQSIIRVTCIYALKLAV